MRNSGKYHNYELHPVKRMEGFDKQAWEGAGAIGKILQERVSGILQQKNKAVVCFDMYPGVRKEEILCLAETLRPVQIWDMEDYARTEDDINQMFADFITNDRVFGVMCHKKIDSLFEAEKLEQARAELKATAQGCVVIMGMGAGILSEGDLLQSDPLGNSAPLSGWHAKLALYQYRCTHSF